MRSVLPIITSVLLIVNINTPAIAIIKNTDFDNYNIDFSGISLVDINTNKLDFCQKRYEAGFTTANHPGSTQFSVKLISDKGHEITVVSRSVDVTEGIFSITSQHEIIFPEDISNTPIRLDVFTTGLIGHSDASGIFSDGICRGLIHIVKI
ncbi:hypothetical protein QT397_02550 (plasmid) [Microbulbifer sp. MKSA007]|nr:hypothetical protein QT397_02550 [Microbulbifer sp. MKSA007]